MTTSPIYLDNHATTRVDPRVVEAMLPYFLEKYGNAASISHRFGWEAGDAVEQARIQVARALNADPREIIFTSGATESNNLAIKGAAWSLKKKGNHLVTAVSEHRSVLDPFKRLAREGWATTTVPCDPFGQVSPDSVESALTEQTVLVSVMMANNEVGTINSVREIGEICHSRGVLFHTDATQALGKLPIDVQADRIDLLSCTAHKLYGPKGIGALYVRRRAPQVRLSPLFDGGGHERGFRSGTLPIPLIVGFGLAVELALNSMGEESSRIFGLRERLHRGISDRVPDITLNGHPTRRLAANLNLSFAYVDGEALMMAMREIAVSSGSACTAANPEPSHVLTAMGRDDDAARASLRFGLGRFTTEAEIDIAIETVADAVQKLRSHSAFWPKKPISVDSPL
ncbi:MAG: IscS subfamily cysteine desulfurase, partial [Planctomycetes bacterium SCN 63-9]